MSLEAAKCECGHSRFLHGPTYVKHLGKSGPTYFCPCNTKKCKNECMKYRGTLNGT